MRNQLKQFQWLKTNQSHFIRRGWMGGIKEIMTFSNSIPHFGSKFPSSASSENNLNSPHVLCVRSLLCMCPTRVSVPATRTRNGKSESESLESSFFCCCFCSFDDDDDAMAEKLDFVSWWHLQIERNAKYWFASTAAYPVPVSRVPVPNTPFLPVSIPPWGIFMADGWMSEWVGG